MRELEAKQPFANLADIVAILIELKQPRVGAARVKTKMCPLELVATPRFARVQALGQLQEVGLRES